MFGLKIIGWHFEEGAQGNGVATVLRKREAVSKESYGKSQKRVRRVWIFMKDSEFLWERIDSGKKSGWRGEKRCLYI